MNPYRCILGGGHGGGLDPPTSLSQGLYSPPQREFPGLHCLWLPWEPNPKGGRPQKGNPSGGVSGVVPPQMAPLISGLLGFGWGVFTGRYRYRFLQIYIDFLGRLFLVIVELYSQLTTCSHICFFFRNRPLEVLLH